MEKEKTEKEEPADIPKMRQVILETDGNIITITKAEVAGKIELIAIFESVLNSFKKT